MSQISKLAIIIIKPSYSGKDRDVIQVPDNDDRFLQINFQQFLSVLRFTRKLAICNRKNGAFFELSLYRRYVLCLSV